MLFVAETSFAATPLERAAASGNLDKVKALLLKGADINAVDGDSTWEKTPLFAAAEAGKIEIVKYLLAQGANTKLTNSATATPLRKAVSKGHVETVKALLESGANVEADTDYYGRSPLVWAIISARGKNQSNYIKILKLLRQAGAKCLVSFIHPVNDSTVLLAKISNKASAEMGAAFIKSCGIQSETKK